MNPTSILPAILYLSSVLLDARDCIGLMQTFSQVNSRHIASGGFAFVFYTTNEAAARALEKPRITIKGKMVNVLAKKQIVNDE